MAHLQCVPVGDYNDHAHDHDFSVPLDPERYNHSLKWNGLWGVLSVSIQLMDDLTKCEKLYMDKAFEYAEEALKILEVPVGCIFVYEDKVIAIGKNDVNRTRNATRHAEMICIDAVVSKYNENTEQLSEVFKEVSVYVTVEPCIMCISALYNLNVKSIVFGCKNDRFGGQTVFDVASVVRPNVIVKGGYRAEEAMNLLKEFYKGTNPNAPESKVKVKSRS